MREAGGPRGGLNQREGGGAPSGGLNHSLAPFLDPEEDAWRQRRRPFKFRGWQPDAPAS